MSLTAEKESDLMHIGLMVGTRHGYSVRTLQRTVGKFNFAHSMFPTMRAIFAQVYRVSAGWHMQRSQHKKSHGWRDCRFTAASSRCCMRLTNGCEFRARELHPHLYRIGKPKYQKPFFSTCWCFFSFSGVPRNFTFPIQTVL